MKTDIRQRSTEDILDLPIDHPDRLLWRTLREFNEAATEEKKLEFVNWLLMIAMPGERLREIGWVAKAWAWDALMDIAYRPELQPEVGELLRRKFFLPREKEKIKRPPQGKDRSKKENRKYDIIREVYILFESGMSERAACRTIGKKRNDSPEAIRSIWKQAVKTGFMLFFPETDEAKRRIVLVKKEN